MISRLPAEFIASMSKVLRPGRLLRFSIREGGLTFNPADGSPAGADLAYKGPANQRRGRADQYSKIVFQWQARRQPLRLADLMTAAAAAAAAADGADEMQAELGS
jgi:snurportin-1